MKAAEPALRASTTKGNERVVSILDAAKDIIVKEGFSGLSYRNIAKSAGIAVGNVNYYPSKDDLMVDLAVYIFDRWGDRFQKRLPSALVDERSIFIFSINFMITENKRDKSASLLMEMWALANHSPSVGKMLDAFYSKMRAWIADMLDRARPGLDPPQLAIRAALITAQIEGLMILIGPRRQAHPELSGLEQAAVAHIAKLAFAD